LHIGYFCIFVTKEVILFTIVRVYSVRFIDSEKELVAPHLNF